MVNIKLVQNYIRGLDTTPYDVSELENSPDFMKYVMMLSKDKRMYEFCSDEVKHNYGFVRGVIDEFSDDFGFVKKVADNYLNSLKLNERESEESDSERIDRIRSMEINFLVSTMEKEANRFTIGAALAYAKEMEKLDLIVKYNGRKFKDELGLGFLLILEQYGSSKIITDFFAERMVNEKFYCSDEDLERFIHRRCRSFNDIKNSGINNFIISTIAGMDTFLANYISANPNLITNLKKDIMGVGVRWDSYMKRLNDYRVNALEKEVFEYLDSSDDFAPIDSALVIKYTAIRLGCEDEFKKRLDYYPLNDDVSLLGKTNDFTLRRALDYAYMVGNELFSVDVIEMKRDDYDEKQDTGEQKAEIIKFPSTR